MVENEIFWVKSALRERPSVIRASMRMHLGKNHD